MNTTTLFLLSVIVVSTICNAIIHGKEGFTWEDKL